MTSNRAFAAALLSCALPAAFAQSFYAGVGVGGTRLANEDFAAQVLARNDSNFQSGGHRAEMKDHAGRLFGGMELNRTLAVEVDYARLGSIETFYRHVSVHGAAFANYSAATTQDVSGIGISGIVRAPAFARMSAFARVGAVRTRTRIASEACSFTPEIGGNRLTGCVGDSVTLGQTRPNAGLGVDVRLADRATLRVGWDRYFGLGKTFRIPLENRGDARGKFDVDLFAVGAWYRF